MRILHTSDWHLGKCLEEISRLEEQRGFVDELCQIADEEGVDVVLISGDVFDTYTPPSAAESLYFYAVERLSRGGERAVIVIAGNHDSPERLCAANPLSYRSGIITLGLPSSIPLDCQTGGGVKIVKAGPAWLELRIEGVPHSAVIIALPYPSEARLSELLTQRADEDELQSAYSQKIKTIFRELSRNFRDDTVNLVTSHLYMLGGRESGSERPIQLGGALTVTPDALPENAHYVALGHLHRPQAVKDAPVPAYYSGSPIAYSFSEADYSKVVYLVDASPKKEAGVKQIYIKAGKKLFQWKAGSIEEAFRKCEENRGIDAYIDLEIRTDRVISAEEQKKLRELVPGIVNIRPVILGQNSANGGDYEGRENKRLDELFCEFYRYKTGTEIRRELLDAFLEVIGQGEEELPASDGGGEFEAEVS
ncbi:exonuclease SbcCD subunit D [Thermoanaerobacterium sp. DL9XJH110]|uniref:exonuclease SbcCD subunit D n=1 Tax=Thermoanaerobacterium sp. DL9XJH110 TaxID=3386643 RepID=UPI003BB77B16